MLGRWEGPSPFEQEASSEQEIQRATISLICDVIIRQTEYLLVSAGARVGEGL